MTNYNEAHYDSKEEEAIDWYQHYMAVSIEGLALEYMAKKKSEGADPSTPMEMAVEARSEEAGEALMGPKETEGGDSQ